MSESIVSNIINVMVDLETLGIKPGCKILSIGATTFQVPVSDTYKFYVAADHGSQTCMDAPDASTMKWWSDQSKEAQDAVFNCNGVHLVEALTRFNNYLLELKENPADRVVLWGNGASFDEPILQEAMSRYGIKPVWGYRDSMCFRTLKEIGTQLCVAVPQFEGTKHNALADAINQAVWADAIFAALARGNYE